MDLCTAASVPFVKFSSSVPATGIDHPLTEGLYLIWDLQISEANKNTHYAQLHTHAELANQTRLHIRFPLLWGSNGKLIQLKEAMHCEVEE